MLYFFSNTIEDEMLRGVEEVSYFVITCVAIIIAAAATVAYMGIKRKNILCQGELVPAFPGRGQKELCASGSRDLAVRFEDLPALTEQEEAQLVEVKDKELLAKIDQVVPGTLKTVADTLAVAAHKKAGPVYRAIIPKGEKLDTAKKTKDAFLPIFRGEDGRIKGQAVLIEDKSGDHLAALGNVDALMNVASMVVGQYYMTQINDQLKGISEGIDKIADFQKNEYKSKAHTLVAYIQKISTFQVEIIENEELRNRELLELQGLGRTCAELLEQANLSLQSIAQKKDLDFDSYEKILGEAETWFQYQQILTEVMRKTAELTYALNLGNLSKENCFEMYRLNATRTEDTLLELNEWHEKNAERLEIDTKKNRRKRQGIEGVLMTIPGLLDNDLNYIELKEETVAQIKHQVAPVPVLNPAIGGDYYQEDVRLIAKDGKLFYLPQQSVG